MEPSKKSRGGSPGNSDRNVNEFVTANKSRTVTAHEIFNSNGITQIPEHKDFTTYKQVVKRCGELADLLITTSDLF